MFRGLLIVALIVGVMVGIKDGRPLERTGVMSSCTAVAAPKAQTGYWHACRAGKLEGRPNLTRHSCVSHGVVGAFEYWRCPSPIANTRS